MSSDEVDAYLARVAEPHRSLLIDLRSTIALFLPDAEQGIAYGLPCFRIDGAGVAGFGSYAKHCTYVPMSGSITTELATDLEGFVTSKGAVRFSAAQPLPPELVRRAHRRSAARDPEERLGVAVLGIGHVLAPRALGSLFALVQALPDREVGHEVVRCRAVPVPFAGRSVDRVARAHLDH